MGLGWSKDEFDAMGVRLGERGARADEFMAVLKAIWTGDPVEFQGKFYRIPSSIIQPKPVQKPYPPIYLAAFAPPALRRRNCNNWLQVFRRADATLLGSDRRRPHQTRAMR
jgi:alkanesulfonate monooxygenase SsuD/methylene tetrahydromethanopterin reductase-like flavin-dependent oxidoreductase (luciferase family)